MIAGDKLGSYLRRIRDSPFPLLRNLSRLGTIEKILVEEFFQLFFGRRQFRRLILRCRLLDSFFRHGRFGARFCNLHARGLRSARRE